MADEINYAMLVRQRNAIGIWRGVQPLRILPDTGLTAAGFSWLFERAPDASAPSDLVSQSRADLSERCLPWLRSLLGYVLPPAKVLEIGCQHGGFAAMLQQAGYQASKLEAARSNRRRGAKKSGLDLLRDNVEHQSVGGRSLDAMTLIDVVERFDEPSETLETCLSLLKPDGILLIATACYPQRKILAQFRKSGKTPPNLPDANAHRFVFSEQSAALLFERLDAPFIEFPPTNFGASEMTLVVSRAPLKHTTAQEQAAALAQTPTGKFVQAMLDLDDRRLDLLAQYRNISQQAQRIAG